MQLKQVWFVFLFTFGSMIFFSCSFGGKQKNSDQFEVSRHLRKIALVKDEHSFYQLAVAGQELFVNGGLDGILVYHVDSENILSFQTFFSNQTVFRDIRVIQETSNRVLLFAVYYLPDQNHTGVGVFSFSEGKLEPLILYHSLKDVSTHRICGSTTLETGEIRVTTADLKQGIQDYVVDVDSRVVVPVEPVLLDTLPAMDVVNGKFYRYVAAGSGGLLMLDLKSGRIVNRFSNALSMAQRVVIQSNLLVLADRMNGIRFFELDSEGNPEYIYQYDTTGDAFSLFLRSNGRELLLADGANGLVWLGIKNREEPVLYGHFMEIESLVYDVTESPLFPGVVYISTGSVGLQVFKLEVLSNKIERVKPPKRKRKKQFVPGKNQTN